MTKKGPIILIDDDKDECDLIQEALRQLGIANKLVCFSNGKEAYDYLLSTEEQPFLIISDINMPVMNGIELRKQINENQELKRKSVPFIFLTTTASPAAVKEAYEMSVQGFFEKGSSIEEIKTQLSEMYNYWQKCRHPNN